MQATDTCILQVNVAESRFCRNFGDASVSNFTVVEAGSWADLGQQVFERGPLKKAGKMFLSERLGATGCELSLNHLPAGDAYNFLHRHRQHEEVYVVVAGRGEMLVDGQRFPVHEGTVIRVAPEGARSLRAAADESLDFICIQAVAGTRQKRNVSDGELIPGGSPW
jgi:mannose-6-phosphate isomerase-like protein (cupin superfamily)